MAIVSIIQAYTYRLRNPQYFLPKTFLTTQQFQTKHPEPWLKTSRKLPLWMTASGMLWPSHLTSSPVTPMVTSLTEISFSCSGRQLTAPEASSQLDQPLKTCTKGTGLVMVLWDITSLWMQESLEKAHCNWHSLWSCSAYTTRTVTAIGTGIPHAPALSGSMKENQRPSHWVWGEVCLIVRCMHVAQVLNRVGTWILSHCYSSLNGTWLSRKY